MSVKDKKNVRPVSKVRGMIHSFETFGALDGPGLRFVVFFEGCPLRCAYCHNRDMLDLKDYMEMSAKELYEKVKDYKEYFGKQGGVTISGGDPVFQPKFLLEFLKLCKKGGIHTTLDTSLMTSRAVLDSVRKYVDVFMISLKHFDDDIHKSLTGVSNKPILENIRYLSDKGAKIWFRYVVLPGYTDTRANLKALREFLKEVKFELIDLLPYHTYGVYKWKKLGLKYGLDKIKPPTMRKVLKIKKMLEKEGYKVLLNS
ncbi:pyruvate formate lyase-activating protein [Patescibacteria group bacterium]|nr:pyruvate formate lyase-activating protein [Patescibacteria group bacterium]